MEIGRFTQLARGVVAKQQGSTVHVHGQDAAGAPSDRVSLECSEQDQGSGFLRKKFAVTVSDTDATPSLKMDFERRGWRGQTCAVITNADPAAGAEARVEVPVGSMAKWAHEAFFTPGAPRSEIYLDVMHHADTRQIKVERDGNDVRFEFLYADGSKGGLTIGSSLTVSRY